MKIPNTGSSFGDGQMQPRDKLDPDSLHSPLSNLFGSPSSASFPVQGSPGGLLSSSPLSRHNPMDYHRLGHPAIAQWLQQAHFASQQQQQQQQQQHHQHLKDEPNDEDNHSQRDDHAVPQDFPEIWFEMKMMKINLKNLFVLGFSPISKILYKKSSEFLLYSQISENFSIFSENVLLSKFLGKNHQNFFQLAAPKLSDFFRK